MNFDFTCNRFWIGQDVPHQIWEGQAADGLANTFVTRFFHNKLLFYLDNYFRCYFHYLSPDFINAAFSIVGLILFLIGVYFAISKRNKLIIVFILLSPIFPLIELPSVKIYQGIITYGLDVAVMIYGLWSLKRKLF